MGLASLSPFLLFRPWIHKQRASMLKMQRCLRIINTQNWRLSKTWKPLQVIITMVAMVATVITAMATVMVMDMDMVITMEDTITMAIMAMVATTADTDIMAVMDTEAIIENWENCSHFSLEYIYL